MLHLIALDERRALIYLYNIVYPHILMGMMFVYMCTKGIRGQLTVNATLLYDYSPNIYTDRFMLTLCVQRMSQANIAITLMKSMGEELLIRFSGSAENIVNWLLCDLMKLVVNGMIMVLYIEVQRQPLLTAQQIRWKHK